MIYESDLPAMNINSISLAPHAADRAAEDQESAQVGKLDEGDREEGREGTSASNSSKIRTARFMKSRGDWRSTPRISWLGKSRHGG